MAKNDSTDGRTVQDIAEQLTRQTQRARAICALATLYEKHSDELPRGSLTQAMWAAQDLLQAVEANGEKLAALILASAEKEVPALRGVA